MKEGIADYLEIMQLAGVSDIKWVRRRSVAPTAVPPPRPSVPDRPVKEKETKKVAPVVSVPVVRIYDDSKAGQLQALADEVAQCTQCKDLAASRTQTVFGVGNPDAPLVFLGEAPGADEDKQGEPFVGRAGQLLTDIITKGMKLRREDVYICNILRCRPPGNRNPMPDEAAHCRPFLDRTLQIIQPKFICCLGTIAAKNLLASEQTIGALRGKVLDFNGIAVVCTYHPAYLLRNPAAKKDTWDDIQLLMREMGMM
ncbi:MAG: uracil-DNA glycosylase [Planctomycetaceae bacterium]|jgi:DNA polymerase|nr:uracil-DNA glycosylase [Planctomycetaceae bacterium]